MSYTFRTKNFGIPAPQLGDVLDENEERRAAEVIDTQLTGLAKTFSGGHGVMKEGTYSLSINGDLTGKVILTSYEGLITQIYTSATSITWDSIPIGTYDLYVSLVESGSSSTQFGNITPIVTTQDLTAESVLLARVVNTGTNITIDTNPSDKTVIRTVASHEAISINPHGFTLYQETIITSGLTCSGLARIANLSISGILTSTGLIIVSGNYAFDGLTTRVLSGTDADINNLTVQNKLRVQSDLNITGSLIVSGDTTLLGNIVLTSGASIDGIDPSTLIMLIDGSNADTLHQHGINPPTYSIVSGANFVTAGRVYFGNLDTPIKQFETSSRHVYDRLTRIDGAEDSFFVIDRIGVTHDFYDLHTTFAELWIRGSVVSGLGITGICEAFDTVGNPIGLSGIDISPSNANTWEKKRIIVSGTGHTFTKGEFYTIRYNIVYNNFSQIDIGEATYPYMRKV